jgi:hypothetical protein
MSTRDHPNGVPHVVQRIQRREVTLTGHTKYCIDIMLTQRVDQNLTACSSHRLINPVFVVWQSVGPELQLGF